MLRARLPCDAISKMFRNLDDGRLWNPTESTNAAERISLHLWAESWQHPPQTVGSGFALASQEIDSSLWV